MAVDVRPKEFEHHQAFGSTATTNRGQGTERIVSIVGKLDGVTPAFRLHMFVGNMQCAEYSQKADAENGELRPSLPAVALHFEARSAILR